MDTRRHQKRREAQPKPAPIINQCVICEQSFETDIHHPNALTCSTKCNDARMNSQRRRKSAYNYDISIFRGCHECGKKYSPNKFSVGVAKFCSKSCSNKSASRAFYSRKKRVIDKRLHSQEWRKAKKIALKRDDNKCQLCGSAEKLHVHHILNMTEDDKNNHSLNNVVVFCNACHNRMHSVRISEVDDQYVASGAIFDYLKITTINIIGGNNA